MSSSFVELNPPDLLFVTLAVVEGCVQRVGHILAVVQLANSAIHILKAPPKIHFLRRYLLAVGVLPKRRLRNPHLFTHFLILRESCSSQIFSCGSCMLKICAAPATFSTFSHSGFSLSSMIVMGLVPQVRWMKASPPT